MRLNVRRFEQIHRIHAWITVGFLGLLLMRQVSAAIYMDPSVMTPMIFILGSLIMGLMLWLHLHAILRRSKLSRCGVVLFDGLLGGLSLYSVIWTVNELGWRLAIKAAWYSMLFSAGMGIWFLGSAIMTGVHLWYETLREGGKSAGDC
ncbi:hypothetical protein [Haloferula sp. A504]|uniref:hypothetical protein n=1 Tax=Haloferula sp. A504 TaxID=3373601 RepID=UPI0031C7D3E1|nr:hypothetical protein [Verrucomicrobiaceae bacterium E54]